MTERPETVIEYVNQKLSPLFLKWKTSWINEDLGPSPGGRRDEDAIGIIDSPLLQTERAAYEKFLTAIVEMLLEASESGTSDETVNAVELLLRVKLPGNVFKTYKADVIIHVLSDVLKRKEESDKIGVQHRVTEIAQGVVRQIETTEGNT